MFSNLPGKRTTISSSRGEACEFNVHQYGMDVLNKAFSGVHSEKFKILAALGEDHQCPNPATVRIQGETDSFGCEYIHYCEECDELDEILSEISEEITGEEDSHCEWCRKTVKRKELSFTRDIDEGSSGPVYEVCGECRSKQNDYINDELDFLAEQGY